MGLECPSEGSVVGEPNRSNSGNRSGGDSAVIPLEEEDQYLQHENASACRSRIAHLLHTHATELTMGLAISYNVALVIHETNLAAKCVDFFADHCSGPTEVWIQMSNIILLAVYLLELGARIYVFRARFLMSLGNVADLVIIGSGVLDEILSRSASSLAFLRIFRLLRLVRALRWLSRSHAFRELYLLINGFLSAMKAIFWAAAFLMILLMVWAILAVDLLHSENKKLDELGSYEDCERCPRAFGSVFDAMLTLFKNIVAGDSWGEVAVPLIERNPLTGVLFAGMLFTISFGLLNLITAVIIEIANDARDRDLHHQLRLKEAQLLTAKNKFEELCIEMDGDHNGSLSVEELTQSFDQGEDLYRVCRMMDIEREELAFMYGVLDVDRDGQLTHSEFSSQMYNWKAKDVRTLLMFLKSDILDTRHTLQKQFDILRADILEKRGEDRSEIPAVLCQQRSAVSAPQCLRTLSSPVLLGAATAERAYNVCSDGDSLEAVLQPPWSEDHALWVAAMGVTTDAVDLSLLHHIEPERLVEKVTEMFREDARPDHIMSYPDKREARVVQNSELSDVPNASTATCFAGVTGGQASSIRHVVENTAHARTEASTSPSSIMPGKAMVSCAANPGGAPGAPTAASET